jgi:hypothetical protein
MAKADRPLVQRRVDDLLRVRLDGGARHDVRDYARSQERESASPWFVPDGENPLSDVQIWRYLQRADRLIDREHERSRKRLFRRHVARLNHLYARAATTGELSVARAILRDLAEMQRLLPRPEDELEREVRELREMLKRITTDGPGHTTAGDSGPAPPDRAAHTADVGALGPAAG